MQDCENKGALMISVDDLLLHLEKIGRISNAEWIMGLDERKRRELEFHDQDRDRPRAKELDPTAFKKIYGNRKYYGGTAISRNYMDTWIRTYAKDRIFLDYACGNGGNAIKAARAGAKLAIGIDISRISVENAKKEGEREKARNLLFIQADAENTKLPDQSVDTVICSGVLHHLDLSYAFPELRRILSPGGRILAMEALNYNPAIKLYRHLTPAMRTEWEKAHILSLADIRFARRFFDIGEIRYWHILSILTPFLKPLLPFFNRIDQILTRIPVVQLLAWTFTFELKKRES